MNKEHCVSICALDCLRIHSARKRNDTGPEIMKCVPLYNAHYIVVTSLSYRVGSSWGPVSRMKLSQSAFCYM